MNTTNSAARQCPEDPAIILVNLLLACKTALEVMRTQEKRESEEFHLSAEAFRPIWDKTVKALEEAIEDAGGMLP